MTKCQHTSLGIFFDDEIAGQAGNDESHNPQ